MSVINTNITSMIGQANLQKSQSALQTSMERLSSGLRINSAKDDAAGQAIANRMSSQITGLAQAQRNSNDGISVAQTAEGALNQVNDNLQRIRELAVQSANGTNSAEDKQSIQDEIGQRLDEIDRISKETSFNGVRVLSEDTGLKIQVGANDGQQISVNLQKIDSSTLNLSNFNVTNESLDTSKLSSDTVDVVNATLNVQKVDFNDTNGAQTFDIYVSDTDPKDIRVTKTGVTDEMFSATFDAATGELTVDTDEAPVAAATTGYTIAASGDDVIVGQDESGNDVIMTYDDIGNVRNTAASAEPTLFQGDNGNLYVDVGGTKYDAAATNYDPATATYGQVTFSSATATTDVTPFTEVTNAVMMSPDAGATVVTSGLDAEKVGDNPEVYSHEDGGYVIKGEVDGQAVYYAAEVADDGTVSIKKDDSGADVKFNADPMASLDAALNQVDSLRSELGAIQNRFESAITNLQTNETNLAAARSRIEDADYAKEVANMTRAQILQQAGTSVLAQANQVPQNVLSLLG